MRLVADSCCSTRLEVKEGVEALSWLMPCVVSMEQIICGLHGKEWSCVGRKRTTPSIRRRRGENGICIQEEGYAP